MSGKQIYYQYKKEKWQIKIKKKYKDFSPEVRKYLIEEKVSNIPFLLECLTDYCFQPDDEDEKKVFAESVDYLYKKYHTFIKAVKFLQKENKEIERFLISAFDMFEDEDGNSTYPGPEACYKYILELSELI
ncbi:MAG TPA: hypothetical protein P5286_02920, partial [Treponemataceae bacterium]|nr:hypothetical protein [Treponemataceae bacterium]